MDTITKKVALVTGGSRGIGAAVALRLAGEGADVVLTYEHSAERAAEVVARVEELGRRALAVRADSADPDALDAAVDQTVAAFGRLDILVNNAGVALAGSVEEHGTEVFDRLLAVNVRAPYLASRAAVRHMGEGGRIINIGSNIGQRTVTPGFTLYALTKTALIGMTKGLARDLGPRAITVNLINPGPTDTDANPADSPFADTVRGLTALGHYADPDDIAATVAHLAGAGGRYITGAVINVDGGFTI